MLAVLRRARDREHGQSERRELGAQARGVERRVHGVAGARVGEPEFEQRRGGERSAAARQPDARRGEAAQIGPRFILCATSREAGAIGG